MPNQNQSYKEKCLEQFEEQFKDSFTYGAMETWEDGLVVRDFISKALEEQMKEVKMIITKEIRIAQLEGQPTSRLTSLYNKLD